MNFNKHLGYEGKHAFLSPSGYHWIRYTHEKREQRWRTWRANERGTELHALACQCIKMGIMLPDNEQTLSLYVNDAIYYKMSPEQVLYYSENCFGTADSISFFDNYLRIHDLKTGEHKASFDQLIVYAAIFCLEYGISPFDISIELRIYQLNEVRTMMATPEQVQMVMDVIVVSDQDIESFKEEERLNGYTGIVE